MHFTKMHGLGNDFVVIAEEKVPADASLLAQTICDRHRGVGADGLVFLTLSEKADLAMHIFNADGSEAEQCGNAIRCVAKYFYENISSKKTELMVQTQRGLQPVSLAVTNGEVELICVDMGVPIIPAELIPVQGAQSSVVDEPIAINEATFHFTAVSMGNPHIVIEVKDTNEIPIAHWGPQLESHSRFPNKTNVEFIQLHSPTEISMRVWERGVGETLACGSGACAALVSQVLRGTAERQAWIRILGGDLYIQWSEQDDHVYMTGPATTVYEGRWT